MKKLLLTLSVGVTATFGFLSNANAQETQIRFFGQPEIGYNKNTEILTPNDWDFTTGAPNYKKRDTSNTNFNTGKLVLFVTSQLSDRISVLSENSAGYNNSTKSFEFEIERLLLRFYYKDYLSVRVGKMFSPLGYWNNQYNLGLVLQPTIQRPLVIRNSTDGGVIQIKDVGVQIEGDNMTKLKVFYRAMVSNGIGYIGNNEKGNMGVALTGQVGFEPVEGLKVLVSGRTAELHKGTTTLTGVTPANGQQSSLNAAIAYMNPEKKPEFIAEYYDSKNSLDSIGDRFSHGYFVYGGYKITSKVTPYAMYSYSQAGTKTQGDNYYVGVDGMLVNVQSIMAGIRYKVSSNLVLKLEYQYSSTNYTYQDGAFPTMPKFGPISLYGGDQKGYEFNNSVRMQFAFAF
jgi:opacity protein-like surface antigen